MDGVRSKQKEHVFVLLAPCLVKVALDLTTLTFKQLLHGRIGSVRKRCIVVEFSAQRYLRLHIGVVRRLFIDQVIVERNSLAGKNALNGFDEG